MTLTSKSLVVMVAVLGSTLVARAQNRFYFEDHTFDVGSSGNEVPLWADVDQPAYALSVHFEFNRDRLTIADVALGAAVSGLSPDFAQGEVSNSSGVMSYGMLFDLEDPITKTLPAGDRLEILRVTIDVVASTPTTADLDLRNNFGPPAKVNSIADDNGDRIAPVLEDATVTIVQPVLTQFTLSFDGPGAIRGVAGGVGSAQLFCLLQHEGEGEGAEGWSYGIRTDGATITDITDEGTMSAPVAEGGLFQGGFLRNDLATGVDTGGATSAVVLCFGCGATLDPNTTQRVAKITVQAPVPAVGAGAASLWFADGVQGVSQPVETVITQSNTNHVPIMDRVDLDVLPGGDGGLQRGDSNNDSSVNISDGVFLLNHLFTGAPAPVCPESADMNDDGSTNISDPVFLFNFLFSGGTPVPAPYPDCGPDPDGEVCPLSTCND